MKKAIIFDVDGTLADVRSISHHLTEGEPDEDRYHELSVGVPAVKDVAEAAQRAHLDGYEVIIVTARKSKYQDMTIRFLEECGVSFRLIFMRGNDDQRPDLELKRSILETIRSMGYKVEKAYEDNPVIVKLWEAEGIETVHIEGYGFIYD